MCVVGVKYFDKYGWVGVKNRDRNYKTNVDVTQSNRYGLQRLYIDDQLSRWTEGLNEYGVCIISASFSVKSDEKEGDKIINQRKAKRLKNNFYSPDGRAIREALKLKSPEQAIKELAKKELAGATYCFNEKECYLLEGGFTVRKEDATKDNPRKYIFKIKKIQQTDKCSCRSNHGIDLEELGYMKNPTDKDLIKARKSSERRFQLANEFMKPKMEEPAELMDALAQNPDDDNFMNPIRIGDTSKGDMVTTGQLLLVPKERTLHYRPIYSSVKFSYDKLNGPKSKTFFEIVSSRKLLSFKEYFVWN